MIQSNAIQDNISQQRRLKNFYHSWGLCVECGKPAKIKLDGTPARRCQNCLKKHAESEKRRLLKIKMSA